MSATTLTLPVQTTNRPFANRMRLYAREARYELLRATRNRAFSLATIGFPTMFFLLFGLGNMHAQHGAEIVRYLLGGYSAFGTVGASLFGVGVALALERASGWLELKRASPAPVAAFLLAKCSVAVVYALVITTLLSALAVGFAHIHLGAGTFLRMLAVAAFAAVPFSAMGMLIAALVPANAAPGVTQLIYLPMSFCSGLWMPLDNLPHWLQRVAPFLPTYHLAELMQETMGNTTGSGSMGTHALVLLGFGVVFALAAAAAFRRMDADQ